MKVVKYIIRTGLGNEMVYASVDHLAVTSIEEHLAMGEGDKLFYDIIYFDGNVVRVFNPIEVGFEDER